MSRAPVATSRSIASAGASQVSSTKAPRSRIVTRLDCRSTFSWSFTLHEYPRSRCRNHNLQQIYAPALRERQAVDRRRIGEQQTALVVALHGQHAGRMVIDHRLGADVVATGVEHQLTDFAGVPGAEEEGVGRASTKRAWRAEAGSRGAPRGRVPRSRQDRGRAVLVRVPGRFWWHGADRTCAPAEVSASHE